MPVAVAEGVGPTTQVTPVVACPSNQKNLGEIVGEVLQWNPDAPVPLIQDWVNNHYREIVDRRNWAGLMVRGQMAVPNVYSQGTVNVTSGSAIVTGTGTTFTESMVGFQFRQGFSTGWYNIASVQSTTQLTLDLPWANQTYQGTGYQILHSIVELGWNVKRVYEILNQRQGYRLFTGVPQAVLNHGDTWRVTTGWTFLLSPREFNPQTGAQFFELYPAPTFQQAFPFLAFIQPPDLRQDDDFVYPYIRTDIIVKLCIADAMLFGGPKKNQYYDQFTAQFKRAEALATLADMEMNDDSQWPKDLQYEFQRAPFSYHGSQWLQQHAGTIEEWP